MWLASLGGEDILGEEGGVEVGEGGRGGCLFVWLCICVFGVIVCLRIQVSTI